MKVLIAPLNWGLGHASRCLPLVERYIAHGDEVVLGGDGESLSLMKQAFPSLRVIELPSLELRYDEDPRQSWFYWRAIPLLVRFALADHYYLGQILSRESFDLVISDNRFGFFSNDVHSVYITHQLYPILPKRLKIFQFLARAVHACVFKRYSEIWVPDYAATDMSLSGRLSRGGRYDNKVKYIGPLSRFTSVRNAQRMPGLDKSRYAVVAVLSGLEPQRSLFEREILARYADCEESVLIVRGKMCEAQLVVKKKNITTVPRLSDSDLANALLQARKIVVRSGYSTIMDLDALGVLHKAELHPTPGQSEQEYLYAYITSKRM